MVTTTTTLPTPEIGDAGSEEQVATMPEGADISIRKVLREIVFVKIDSTYNVRFIMQHAVTIIEIMVEPFGQGLP